MIIPNGEYRTSRQAAEKLKQRIETMTEKILENKETLDEQKMETKEDEHEVCRSVASSLKA